MDIAATTKTIESSIPNTPWKKSPECIHSLAEYMKKQIPKISKRIETKYEISLYVIIVLPYIFTIYLKIYYFHYYQ
jgi:hypothetical protein